MYKKRYTVEKCLLLLKCNLYEKLYQYIREFNECFNLRAIFGVSLSTIIEVVLFISFHDWLQTKAWFTRFYLWRRTWKTSTLCWTYSNCHQIVLNFVAVHTRFQNYATGPKSEISVLIAPVLSWNSLKF